MRALEKNALDGANINTNRQTDMATLGLNRPSGADSVRKKKISINIKKKNEQRNMLV